MAEQLHQISAKLNIPCYYDFTEKENIVRKYIEKMSAAFCALLIITAGVLIIPTPQANALTYFLTDAYPTTRSGWGGGAFWVHEMNGTDQVKEFKSFCLEKQEYFWWDISYNGTIDSYAVNGGISGGGQDPLDDKTAYLYLKYLSSPLGDISGEYGLDQIDQAYQTAIWFIENEITSLPSNILAQTLYDEANGAVTAQTDPWHNNGRVAVLNLTDDAGKLKQSQTYLVPEPATIMFLGFGLLSLGMAVRRRKR